MHKTLPAPDDYFVAEVRRQLLADGKIGATAAEREAKVFGGGLRIYTTFDPVAQQQAVAARDGRLPLTDGQFPAGTDPATGQPRFGSGALISIEPATGAIRTMVGGPGFKNYQYNITTQGGRNPGSSFKPFVLATLMSQGKSPEDIADGRGPCKFSQPEGQPPYEVENFDNSPGAPGTIRELTLRSSNCGYVRLGYIADLHNVVAAGPEARHPDRHQRRREQRVDAAGHRRASPRRTWPRPTPPSPTTASTTPRT